MGFLPLPLGPHPLLLETGMRAWLWERVLSMWGVSQWVGWWVCVCGGVWVGSCVSMHRGDSNSMRPFYHFPPSGVDGHLYYSVWLVGGWSKEWVVGYVVELFKTYTSW